MNFQLTLNSCISPCEAFNIISFSSNHCTMYDRRRPSDVTGVSGDLCPNMQQPQRVLLEQSPRPQGQGSEAPPTSLNGLPLWSPSLPSSCPCPTPPLSTRLWPPEAGKSPNKPAVSQLSSFARAVPATSHRGHHLLAFQELQSCASLTFPTSSEDLFPSFANPGSFPQPWRL